MCEKDIFTPEQSEETQLVKVHPSIFVLLLEKGCHPNFPLASLLSLLLERLFCCTRIKLLVPHFPIGKGGVPKMQKTRACESPGFLISLYLSD